MNIGQVIKIGGVDLNGKKSAFLVGKTLNNVEISGDWLGAQYYAIDDFYLQFMLLSYYFYYSFTMTYSDLLRRTFFVRPEMTVFISNAGSTVGQLMMKLCKKYEFYA